MIASASAFLCLLHINFWVLASLFLPLKTKCDHIHHACTDGFAPTWWRWSRRAFLCLLRIKFWAWFLFINLLDKAAILSYNTTPAEVGRSSSLFLATWLFWPHVCYLFVWGWPHIGVGMFLLYSLYISYLPAERFLSASTTWNQDHMPIIQHSDLTTSLTINRTGVHGDKLSGEYEKAVFA